MITQNVFQLISRSTVLFLLILGLLTPLQAQFGKLTKRAKDRAQNKVERKANQTVDQTVDKALDKLFKKAEDAVSGKDKDKKKKEEDSKDNSANDNSSSNGGEAPSSSDGTLNKDSDSHVKIVPGEIDENVEPSKWIGTFTMKVEEYEDDRLMDDYPQLITYHVDKYKIAIEPKAENGESPSIIIFDRQTRKVTTKTISDGKKTAFSMTMPPVEVQVEEEQLSNKDFKSRKTGRTKTIAGFRCEEYKFETEETVAYVWTSKSMGFNFMDMYSWVKVQDNTQQGQHVGVNEFYDMDGSVMESISTELATGNRSFMSMTSVNEGRVDYEIFSLDGYETNDLESIMNSPEAQKLGDMLKKLSEEDN